MTGPDDKDLVPYPEELAVPLWRGAVAHRFAPHVFDPLEQGLPWPPGPWFSEPDRIEWRTAGFPCLMVRSFATGAWCGYVAVPPGHPWHGKPHDEVDAHAHGGLSYSNGCGGLICHTLADGEIDGVWWVGFDCAHTLDGQPCFAHRGRMMGTYRDVPFVREEVESLAYQAKAAAERAHP